jgi:hypothetical protein
MNTSREKGLFGGSGVNFLPFIGFRAATPRFGERKGKKVVTKEILLVHKNGNRRRLEQKTNGSLWQGGEKIFSSEAEAGQKGWKVDAVKVILIPVNPRENPEVIGHHEWVAR